MTKREFDLLLEESIKTFGDQYVDIPEEAWSYTHEFSPEFERKMEKERKFLKESLEKENDDD